MHRPPCQIKLRRRLRARAGFSTIEILGAVVMMLILGTVALAATRLYRTNMPVQSAASRLEHAIAAARTMAISHNGTYTLAIDLRTANFWIDETDPNDPTGATVLVPKVVAPQTLGEQVVLTAYRANSDLYPVFRIPFTPDGSSTQESYIYLRQLADKNSSDPNTFTTLRVYGATGQTHIFEHQKLLPA